MANDLVAVAKGYGQSILSRVYSPQEKGYGDISTEVGETQFELSCIGRPRFLRPLYRLADSIGISSSEKRIDGMVNDVEHSVGILERRIEMRSKELGELEARYEKQKRSVISKRADAKSALERGKSFLKNGNEVNDKDELLDLANTYSEYKKTEKLIGDYKQTLRWLESERSRQKDKAAAIKKLFHDGKKGQSQQ